MCPPRTSDAGGGPAAGVAGNDRRDRRQHGIVIGDDDQIIPLDILPAERLIVTPPHDGGYPRSARGVRFERCELMCHLWHTGHL
jgi:hypothetical protein